jgi:DNA-binding transcriptional ArsR family regulator
MFFQAKDELDQNTAEQLESLFKVMANMGRLRMIHEILKAGEICVSDLCNCVNMSPQAVSNQLQRLVDRGILGSRRSGNNILYRITNPCVVQLLNYGLCILESERGIDGRTD